MGEPAANVSMLSIREFSDFTGLSESTLRYYDKIGLLSPAFRGDSLYRYYAPFQIFTTSFIKTLTRLGVPLNTIKELSRDRTPQAVLFLLERQQNILNAKLFELQIAYSITQAYRGNIQAGLFAPEQDICVQELVEARLTLGPAADFSAGDAFYKPFMDFCNLRHEKKIDMHYPIGAYHGDADSFLDAPARPDRFFSLDPQGEDKRLAGQYLVGYARGFYGEFGDLPQRMAAHALDKDIALSGPVYTVYLLDEVSVRDHARYLSQIAIKIAKNS